MLENTECFSEKLNQDIFVVVQEKYNSVIFFWFRKNLIKLTTDFSDLFASGQFLDMWIPRTIIKTEKRAAGTEYLNNR